MFSSYLLDRWKGTLRKAGVGEGNHLAPLFEEICRQYGGPDRHYHSLDHLEWCFSVLESVSQLPGIGSVELGIWYHDYFYDTHADDNEEQSARLAVSKIHKDMGLPQPFALQVGQLILATKHIAIPATREAQVLLDVDLSILGSDPSIFALYEEGVQREYAWVPEALFRRRRADVLQRFLDRPNIYTSHEFKGSVYEVRARKNLADSISRLRSA